MAVDQMIGLFNDCVTTVSMLPWNTPYLKSWDIWYCMHGAQCTVHNSQGVSRKHRILEIKYSTCLSCTLAINIHIFGCTTQIK